jgi:hypothetical protein
MQKSVHYFSTVSFALNIIVIVIVIIHYHSILLIYIFVVVVVVVIVIIIIIIIIIITVVFSFFCTVKVQSLESNCAHILLLVPYFVSQYNRYCCGLKNFSNFCAVLFFSDVFCCCCC